jgi:hypothetical protein
MKNKGKGNALALYDCLTIATKNDLEILYVKRQMDGVYNFQKEGLTIRVRFRGTAELSNISSTMHKYWES